MLALICLNSLCPGKHFAEADIWLAMATVVATLQIEKAKDDTGSCITPDAAFTSGFVRCAISGHFDVNSVLITLCSHPESFDCVIKPRSEKASLLIHQNRANREYQSGICE